MRKRKLANVAASVHDRLLFRARAEGKPFNELLQYYAIERFLFRLSRSKYADLFVLKGALMYQFWGGLVSRSTRDIDLLGTVSSSVGQMVDIVRECLAVEAEDDGLQFDSDSVRGEEIRIEANYQGVRVTFAAYLEKAQIRLQVDVGFGDVITPGVTRIVYPSLIGLQEPRLLGYTPETTVAEKMHAMVVRDMANSRMKDFYDLWLLACGREFGGAVLAEALLATFRRRKTSLPDDTPIALSPAFSEAPEKQMQWRAYLRKARIAGDQPTLRQVAEVIASFVMPAIESSRQGLAFQRIWTPGGPWKDAESRSR